MATLSDYHEIAPKGTIDFISRMAERVKSRRLLNISATRYGGGVAEILHRMVPMLTELGVDAAWEVITGNPLFYRATRSASPGAPAWRRSHREKSFSCRPCRTRASKRWK